MLTDSIAFGPWTYGALTLLVAFFMQRLLLVPAPTRTYAAAAQKQISAVLSRISSAHAAEIAALTDNQRALLVSLRALLLKSDAGSAECNASEERCSAILRAMIAGGMLDLSLVESAPAYIEHVHRLIVEFSATSLFIKVTVHVNLFLGSIVALANDKQRAEVVQKVSKDHCFGSFGLTEKSAGVTSGLVVDTTAHYNAESNSFTLNSGPKGEKNWISNGKSSFYMLIFARTFVGDVDRGIQLFLLKDIADSASFKRTYVEDKHHLQGLDNVTVLLTNHVVKEEDVLDRITPLPQILDAKSTVKPVPFLTLANRLLSGRVFISIATLQYFTARLAIVFKHLTEREIDLMGQKKTLFELEHNYTLLLRMARITEMISHYVTLVKNRYYTAVLTPGSVVNEDLMQQINICKSIVPHFSLVCVNALKSLAGSAAFFRRFGMDDTINVLLAAKIAEGDDRIMSVKIAMDALKGFNKASMGQKVAQMSLGWMIQHKRPFALHLLQLARTFFNVPRSRMAQVYAENTGLISRTGMWAAWSAVFAQWEMDGKTKTTRKAEGGAQWGEVKQFVEERFQP